MKSGQITIYFTLVFTLILSLFLSAFEAARGSHLKVRMENAVQTAIHSAFGEYHRELFERYGLLFIDTSYMSSVPDYHKLEGRLEEYLEYNLNPDEEQSLLFARDWYGIQDYNVNLTDIRLATDDGGRIMRNQAVNYIQNYVGGDWIEEVRSWITVTENEKLNEDRFAEYRKEMEEAEETENIDSLLGTEWENGIGLPSLDFLSTYSDSTIWQNVYSNQAGISMKAFNPLEHVSFRIKNQGTGTLEEEQWDITQNLFFGEYIIRMMGNYTNVRENSKLDYQVEYILFGSGQDCINFTMMLEALFLFRGSANLVMLLSDSETQEWIKVISELGLLIGIPPELLVVLVNVCWVGAESLEDVKRLIKGEKVALLKKPEDFYVDIEYVLLGGHDDILPDNSVQNNTYACLGYEDYLRIFLFFLPESIKTFRCMDMMEADIRMTEGNEYFRMDACADAVGMEIGVTDSYEHFYIMERKYSYY